MQVQGTDGMLKVYVPSLAQNLVKVANGRVTLENVPSVKRDNIDRGLTAFAKKPNQRVPCHTQYQTQ